jgi:hypothetical protein
MSKIKDILLEKVRFQKSGKYYKIPIPPKKIKDNKVHPKGYYQITLHLRDTMDIIYEDLIFPSGLQKQGVYYKISIPPDYVNYELIVLNAEYDITLHLLHLPLEDGVYVIKNGKIQKSSARVDESMIKQVF